MIKRPEKIIKYLKIQKKKDGIFLDHNKKQLMKYYIEIPYWIGKAFERNTSSYVCVEFGSRKLSLNEMRFREQCFRWNDYLEKVWQPRLKKIRKLNKGFIQSITKGKGRNWFKSMDDYNKYHTELKKLNEKYLKTV